MNSVCQILYILSLCIAYAGCSVISTYCICRIFYVTSIYCICRIFYATSMNCICQIIDFSINGLSTENLLRSQLTPKPCKIKVKTVNWSFGDKNRVNSSNFNAMILKFSEKFDHPFWHVFIFGNISLESHGFVAMPVTRRIIDTCSNISLSN